MKKIILTISIFLLAMVSVNAQVSFGVKAGVNFANITGDNTDDLSSRTSFVGGVFAEIPMTEKFTFQPELMYSGQGAKISVENIEGTVTEETLKLDYLNAPFIFKYYVKEGFNVQAGPQLGILLSSKSDEFDYSDLMKTVDFGMNFGLGYKLKNGINFEARYNLGLSNIWDTYYDGNDALINNKNGVWQLTLGYAIK